MAGLLESASLFEVNVPEYKQLRACRRESLLLKTLWDFVYIVRTSIDDWKTTLWREINVEQMDIDCNRFVDLPQPTSDIGESRCVICFIT